MARRDDATIVQGTVDRAGTDDLVVWEEVASWPEE
jgi:hypothetical protein